MTRGRDIDVVVVGGGVVGAACALALARCGLETTLVEAAPPRAWDRERPDLRVYALAADNVALLDALQAWTPVAAARVQPYRRMRVWDAAGGGELDIRADVLGRAGLGWIVEQALLVDRLWAALPEAGVQLRCPARVEALDDDGGRVRLRLDDGSQVGARIAVAADGAQSTLRQLAGIEVDLHEHGQRGVVGFIASERDHLATAWQRFLPGGPLAFLPFADGNSSIVWSLPDADAERVLALDDDTFGRELERAFDRRLGTLRPVSPRAAFPLRRQLAREYVRGRVLVLGDAAHVVHPLAGQGVNLGLRDVAALRDSVAAALRMRGDWAAPSRLARWARQRRSEDSIAAHAFSGIDRLFRSANPAAVLLRGPMLGVAGKLPPLTRALWRKAAGL